MEELRKLKNLPPRRLNAHKGEFGRVAVVGCSPGMTGAGCLAAHAAQIAGAGLITLALPESLALVGELYRASIMSLPLTENENGVISLLAVPEIDQLAEKSDVCAIGPGLGQEPETAEMVTICTREIRKPLVIDADALNALSHEPDALKEREAPAVITPHPGEMARLIGLDGPAAVQEQRHTVAIDAAKKFGVVTVLKGYETIVTDGNTSYLNATGNPGMASGGMGDVLTGIISAFIGQGMSCLDAACLGVLVHGLAGDLGAEEAGQNALTPETLIKFLPDVMVRLEQLDNFFGPKDLI